MFFFPRFIAPVALALVAVTSRPVSGQPASKGEAGSVDFFEKAIVEDAHYALAHSGLSDAYSLLTHYGVLAPTDVWTKAASSAASAVMLDGDSAYLLLATDDETELEVRASTGLPSARRCASPSMAKVLPTPGAAPR